MGDMADFALDEIMDEDEISVNYSGTYCDAEAFELGLIDEHGFICGTEKKSITCRCCKTEGLHWGEYKGKWRLFDNSGTLHNCSVNPLKL